MGFSREAEESDRASVSGGDSTWTAQMVAPAAAAAAAARVRGYQQCQGEGQALGEVVAGQEEEGEGSRAVVPLPTGWLSRT